MKKSKEYISEIISAYNTYLETKDISLLTEKVNELNAQVPFLEVKELVKLRNAQTNTAVINICKEQREKYKKIVLAVNSYTNSNSMLIADFDKTMEMFLGDGYSIYKKLVLDT